MTYLLDGNAIAGDLFVAFDREMTAVVGRCRECVCASAVVERCLYARAPGMVARYSHPARSRRSYGEGERKQSHD